MLPLAARTVDTCGSGLALEVGRQVGEVGRGVRAASPTPPTNGSSMPAIRMPATMLTATSTPTLWIDGGARHPVRVGAPEPSRPAIAACSADLIGRTGESDRPFGLYPKGANGPVARPVRFVLLARCRGLRIGRFEPLVGVSLLTSCSRPAPRSIGRSRYAGAVRFAPNAWPTHWTTGSSSACGVA